MITASPETEARVLASFRRAAGEVPAYAALLHEHATHVDRVVDLQSFSSLCPVLNKANTFDRFALDELCASGALRDVAGLLTSSGHGGRFSFGVIARKDVPLAASFTDQALDAAFQVRSRSTLAVNCLPMGVGFSSDCMTVATTSVREDMVVALVEAFAKYYEQLLIVVDPLFMTKLLHFARELRVDWRSFRVNVVIGEEIFGEHFRSYLAAQLGLDLDRPEYGYIMSSFGVGELGLHLCYETPVTIALRRAAATDPAFAQDLLGRDDTRSALPMVFAFNPLRTFIEVTAPDAAGYGQMTVSMLDPELPLPLLRYQPGDVVRLLDADAVSDVVGRYGVVLPGDLPESLVALRGRSKERLPNGSHVGLYKDAQYADHQAAGHLTGACRMIFSGKACTMHVQLTKATTPRASVEDAILHAIPSDVRPARVVLWPYAEFPFGMSLDYERKFSYYVPGEQD